MPDARPVSGAAFKLQPRPVVQDGDVARLELDEVDAAALVGAVLGALNAAAIASLGRGDAPDQIHTAMQRAVDVALNGGRGAGRADRENNGRITRLLCGSGDWQSREIHTSGRLPPRQGREKERESGQGQPSWARPAEKEAAEATAGGDTDVPAGDDKGLGGVACGSGGLG